MNTTYKDILTLVNSFKCNICEGSGKSLNYIGSYCGGCKGSGVDTNCLLDVNIKLSRNNVPYEVTYTIKQSTPQQNPTWCGV